MKDNFIRNLYSTGKKDMRTVDEYEEDNNFDATYRMKDQECEPLIETPSGNRTTEFIKRTATIICSAIK